MAVIQRGGIPARVPARAAASAERSAERASSGPGLAVIVFSTFYYGK
jgi:hypothetical protein